MAKVDLLGYCAREWKGETKQAIQMRKVRFKLVSKYQIGGSGDEILSCFLCKRLLQAIDEYQFISNCLKKEKWAALPMAMVLNNKQELSVAQNMDQVLTPDE